MSCTVCAKCMLSERIFSILISERKHQEYYMVAAVKQITIIHGTRSIGTTNAIQFSKPRRLAEMEAKI